MVAGVHYHEAVQLVEGYVDRKATFKTKKIRCKKKKEYLLFD